jgi:hypothetical protein
MVARKSSLAAGTWLAVVVALTCASSRQRRRRRRRLRSYPSETLHGLGWAVILGCLVGHCWAARVVWCWAAVAWQGKSFSLSFFFCFQILVLFTDLNLLFDFKFEFYLILQVLIYLNIKTS